MPHILGSKQGGAAALLYVGQFSLSLRQKNVQNL
jgi:hypothetical protein